MIEQSKNPEYEIVCDCCGLRRELKLEISCDIFADSIARPRSALQQSARATGYLIVNVDIKRPDNTQVAVVERFLCPHCQINLVCLLYAQPDEQEAALRVLQSAKTKQPNLE